MKKISILFLSALLAWLFSTANAEMYRWTDSQGNVVYSQRPPPDDRQSKIIAPAAGPSAEQIKAAREQLDQKVQNLNASGEKRLKEKETANEKNTKTDASKKQCDIAKSNLQKIMNRPANTLFQVGDDDYKRFTTEERDAQLKKFKDAIKQYCKK